jgi:hypothetical protein
MMDDLKKIGPRAVAHDLSSFYLIGEMHRACAKAGSDALEMTAIALI